MSPLILRPARRRRVIYLVGAWGLLALSVLAAFYAPVVGLLGSLFWGFAAVNAAVRMWHPRAYATEVDGDGFRAYNWRGRLVHDVPWVDVAHLTIFHGNGLRGAGSVLFLAWRCEPRRRRRGVQPWVRGGRNKVGETYDGALPDEYLGIERMLALFKEHADAAKARAYPRAFANPVLDVEAF